MYCLFINTKLGGMAILKTFTSNKDRFVKCKLLKNNINCNLKLIDYDENFYLIEDEYIFEIILKTEILKLTNIPENGKA